jgi:hypothetical protein
MNLKKYLIKQINERLATEPEEVDGKYVTFFWIFALAIFVIKIYFTVSQCPQMTFYCNCIHTPILKKRIFQYSYYFGI